MSIYFNETFEYQFSKFISNRLQGNLLKNIYQKYTSGNTILRIGIVGFIITIHYKTKIAQFYGH